MTGLCECGCGLATTRIKKSNRSRGDVAGEYRHFRQGHQIGRGAAHMNYRGGKSTMSNGYVKITSGMDKLEHVAVVERALGKTLGSAARIHHVDGNRQNNAPDNLVACDSHAYHMLLHKRQRALDACGDPNAHRCVFCSGYDRQDEMTVCALRDGGERAYHKDCNNRAARQHRDKCRANRSRGNAA